MKHKHQIGTVDLSSVVPKVVEAALSGNKQRLELLSLNLIRSFRIEYPQMAKELSVLLSAASANGGAMRWHKGEPPPSDTDAGLSLVRVQSVENASEPIFDPTVNEFVHRFLRERQESQRLLQEGFGPPRTLLIKGAPGTGKTMLACWLARKLNLNLVVLDLATSISSYLGKTGTNLRRSLDYARATPCVLLLDEFDAIAKRRDDATEIGELKRIVNVLLKELEEWPMHSVLIAATNHPELLDPAIHRRFDLVLEVALPGEQERELILARTCGRFTSDLPQGFITALARILDGTSGSELDTFAQAVLRRHLVDESPLAQTFVKELARGFSGRVLKKGIGALAKGLQDASGLSVREIAALIGKSSSAVQYHLGKEEHNA